MITAVKHALTNFLLWNAVVNKHAVRKAKQTALQQKDKRLLKLLLRKDLG